MAKKQYPELKLSTDLIEHLETWEPFNVDALIVLQDKADEKQGAIALAEQTVKKMQRNTGTGYVIGKCKDENHIDPRLADIRIGDRVKFPSGVTMSAEVPRHVPERERVHILHLQNLIMIDRCGPDNLSSIREFESTVENSDDSTESGQEKIALDSLERHGHILSSEAGKSPIVV